MDLELSKPHRICHQAGGRTKCLPVEVGCGGFAAPSSVRAFRTLGIEGERRGKAIRSATVAAERACGLKEGSHGGMVARPPGHKLGHDKPRLGHLEAGVDWPSGVPGLSHWAGY